MIKEIWFATISHYHMSVFGVEIASSELIILKIIPHPLQTVIYCVRNLLV